MDAPRKHSPEAKARIAASLRGKQHSDERRAAIGAGVRAMHARRTLELLLLRAQAPRDE